MTMATSRDIDHALVGGVCAGIASRYRYPVRGVRAATLALSVATAGLGGIAYLALWRVLPPRVREEFANSSQDGSRSQQSDGYVAVIPTADPQRQEIISKATPASIESLYGSVATDLPLVRETIGSVAQGVGFDFLAKMLEQSLAGTGKMMRPAIALLAGRLGSYELDKLVPLAASVELLHTATLVHDDVIDEADERRGNETSNSLFGNSASVMLGDYMFANAAELITRTGNIQVVKNFAATLMMMVRGELNQDVTVFEYSEDVQRYLDRITGKTASLFATCAEGGALVCGAPADQVEAMRLYGLRLGIAFQIVDDILDFTGDPEVMGKPAVGSDLRGGTLTLPAILYMQREPDDNPIKRAFDGQRRRANLDRAIAEILEGDFIDESMATASRFGEEARETLQSLPSGDTRDTLDALVDYVLARSS
jgi:geranylgeranyl pyrophosphate synthase/phage shock protein PspC (stress-responsive transcriptional regulator)